jgi:hypothetical protein
MNGMRNTAWSMPKISCFHTNRFISLYPQTLTLKKKSPLFLRMTMYRSN